MMSDSTECIVIDCSSDEEDDSVQHIPETKPKNLTNGHANNGYSSPNPSIVVDITTPVKRQPQESQQETPPSQQQKVRAQDMSPQELLEVRRKKIDQQLDLLERCHQRLSSIVHLMNPTQRQRWQNVISSSNQPISNGQASSTPLRSGQGGDNQVPASSSSQATGFSSAAGGPGRPPWRRPPWFIDPVGPPVAGGSRSGGSTSYGRTIGSSSASVPMDADDDDNDNEDREEFNFSASSALRPYTRPRTKYKRKRKAPVARRRAATTSTVRKPRKTTSTVKSTPKFSSSSVDRKPKMMSKVKKEY